MHTVSTNGLAAGERFAFWHEVSSRTWVPYELSCDPDLETSFQARMDIWDLGSLQVALMTTTPYVIRRTAKLIRQDDPGLCKLGIAVDGAGNATQNGRETAFGVGDLVLYDTSRPYSATLSTDSPVARLLVLRFSRDLLPLPARDLDRLTAVRIPGSQGVGALTSTFLLQLARHIGEYSPTDLARLSTPALEALTAALAHELEAGDAVPLHTRRRALLAQIHTFIQQNLSDPDLSPASIAAAHHISLRHLHNLFNEQGRTVAGWIRERRLEHCRRDLAEPLLATRRISEIAARWGFSRPQHFTQAFRDAYGLSPRQYREEQYWRARK
ncbi:helix-turn-helix domain-containing protein [Actinomadura sp. NPDC048021]|uniref:AraC-like ligand-binding domain-containing protein n=1 Tax=Actinomadura sp. NPDC048021 TaxID=3155385 RepID=UPI0033DD0473